MALNAAFSGLSIFDVLIFVHFLSQSLREDRALLRGLHELGPADLRARLLRLDRGHSLVATVHGDSLARQVINDTFEPHFTDN